MTAERKPPTPRQLAEAADIALRFAATAELTPEERTQVENAGHMMGLAAVARELPKEQP